MNATWHERHPMPRNPTTAQRITWHVEHHAHCNCRPIPPKLQAQIRLNPQPVRAGRGNGTLRDLLSDGDRRSLAKSERVRALVREAPQRVGELAELANDKDYLVSMRAMDLLEKLAREHPAWVQPYKKLFIGPLADAEGWEILARDDSTLHGILQKHIDSFERSGSKALATRARSIRTRLFDTRQSKISFRSSDAQGR